MRRISRRGTALVAAVAGGLALALALGGAAGAEQARGGGGNVATVKAKISDRELVFAGADEVEAGAKLRFVNRTDPEDVGPHTFSLVRKSEVPETREQQRKCFRGDNVCARIAQAHRFEPPDTINRPSVDRGEEGWDKRFGKSGDSFYTEKRGGEETRRVRVREGGRMWFICAVHPEMQQKVKVAD